MRLVIPEVKKQETVSIDTSSITSEYVIQCSTILPDVKREGRVIDYTDKIYLARIMPVGEKTRHSKYRTAENGYSDEFHRLVEDEVFAIIKTGKGFCFNEKFVLMKNRVINYK